MEPCSKFTYFYWQQRNTWWESRDWLLEELWRVYDLRPLMFQSNHSPAHGLWYLWLMYLLCTGFCQSRKVLFPVTFITIFSGVNNYYDGRLEKFCRLVSNNALWTTFIVILMYIQKCISFILLWLYIQK